MTFRHLYKMGIQIPIKSNAMKRTLKTLCSFSTLIFISETENQYKNQAGYSSLQSAYSKIIKIKDKCFFPLNTTK